MMESPKHIVVLGAGLAGLSAAYDLVKNDYRVTILEASPYLGGLATSFRINGTPVERFYHFICRADHDLINFIGELGLESRLHWRQNNTAFFFNQKLYPFGTPVDLLHFSTIPWDQRLRFGIHILRSRMRSKWRWLDQIPAKPWLIENIGEEAYKVIWEPLLRIKFGEYHERISSAWVWHRIWRVAQSRGKIWEHESFGYLENGSSTLVDHLVGWLEANPAVKIMTDYAVNSLEIQDRRVKSVIIDGSRLACDAVISTIALPKLETIITNSGSTQIPGISRIQYIGVVCALFNLKQPFSRNFWMNINDPQVSFNGIIEQTNLNHNLKAANLNLIYVPFYIPTDHPRFSATNGQLYAEYLPMLKKINPAFEENWISDYAVFRTPFAQAICTTGFRELIPEIRTSISGLYLTDSAQFYPEDRTISAAIRKGRQAASFAREDFLNSDRSPM